MDSCYSKFRPILVVVAVVTVAGCANGFIASTNSIRDQSIEPRVAILETCPKAGVGAVEEAGILEAVAGTLIPAVVDTGFNAIDVAFQNAAKSDTESVSILTSSRFYSTGISQERASESFEIRNNAANGCLVVAHGPMSEGAPSAGFTGLYFLSKQQDALIKGIGLHGNPYFYYEGRFVYSIDRSAFRIESEVIKYDRTIKDGSTGVRGLALNFSFALPSASSDGNVFATTTIQLGNLRTGTTVERSSAVVTENATKYSTPWMPLPSVSDNLKTALSEAQFASENLVSTMGNLKKTYVARIDSEAKIQGIAESDVDLFLTAIDQGKVKAKLTEIRNNIALLSKEITDEMISLDDTVVTLREKLEKERKGLDGAKEVERAISARIALLKARNELARKRGKLKVLIDVLAEVTILETADRNLYKFSDSINRFAVQLAQFTPFTVKVTIVEKRDANAVLKFLADVFTAAKPNLVAGIGEEIDPKTKKELEDKEKATEAARQDEFSTLRKVAALTILKVQGTEIELRLLKPDAGEIVRHNAEVKFQTAVFEASNACQKAVRKLAHPPECAPYL